MFTQPYLPLMLGQEVVLDAVHTSYRTGIVELSDGLIWVEVPTAYALQVQAAMRRQGAA